MLLSTQTSHVLNPIKEGNQRSQESGQELAMDNSAATAFSNHKLHNPELKILQSLGTMRALRVQKPRIRFQRKLRNLVMVAQKRLLNLVIFLE
jgi:hypothetical protein